MVSYQINKKAVLALKGIWMTYARSSNCVLSFLALNSSEAISTHCACDGIETISGKGLYLAVCGIGQFQLRTYVPNEVLGERHTN